MQNQQQAKLIKKSGAFVESFKVDGAKLNKLTVVLKRIGFVYTIPEIKAKANPLGWRF